MHHRAAVITVSDRAAAGEREDGSGPIAVAAFEGAGWSCEPARVVADGEASVAAALRTTLDAGVRVVVTTGGTGIAPRDRTPEGTLPALTRQLPGIAEELRRIGAARGATGLLSRGVAGIAAGAAGEALVVNLPGSPGAVRDGMPVVLAVAEHAIAQLEGSDHA